MIARIGLLSVSLGGPTFLGFTERLVDGPADELGTAPRSCRSHLLQATGGLVVQLDQDLLHEYEHIEKSMLRQLEGGRFEDVVVGGTWGSNEILLKPRGKPALSCALPTISRHPTLGGLPFQRGAIPLREVCSRFVGALKKGKQCLVGRQRLADGVVRQDELAEIGAVESFGRLH